MSLRQNSENVAAILSIPIQSYLLETQHTAQIRPSVISQHSNQTGIKTFKPSVSYSQLNTRTLSSFLDILTTVTRH